MKLWILAFAWTLSACAPQVVQREAAQISRPAVVLVHGFFSDGSTLSPLKRSFQSLGYDCYSPSLKPNDGREGIDQQAIQLRDEISQNFGDQRPIHLVAHSMGGIVSRYYLEELGGYRRCVGLHTIASPHQGTMLAKIYPGKGARQMEPESEFLKKLNAKQSGYPETSYRTPYDLVILPSESSIRPNAENYVIPAASHSLLPHDKRLLEAVTERVKSLDRGTMTRRY